ncbi:MAG: DUF2262 domain-containing protein [Saonia sp.]
MGVFSKFRHKDNINLTKSDFKTQSERSEVISVKLSDDFFDKFPDAKKKDNYLGNSTLTVKTASISLFNNPVEVVFYPIEIKVKEEKFISKMNQTLNWISSYNDKIEKGIVDKLLFLKNEAWLEENETEINETEFKKKLTLTSILFLADSSSELVYDDGDLFWGHQIVVGSSAENELTDINIRG